MSKLVDSPRLHVVPATAVMPLTGRLAPRPLTVYLPAAAEQQSRRRFPVLYCQDGQNIWDDPQICYGHGGWYLNRIVDELTAAGEIEPVIVVGIPHGRARYREYTPGASYLDSHAHPYVRFVVDVVQPYIAAHFPVRRGSRHAALLGSSLGGLAALWLAHENPARFGQAACLSGAFWAKDGAQQTFADYLRARGRQPLRIYLDAGTVDDGAAQTRRVRDVFRELGWRRSVNLEHYEDDGGEHNERCWRHRVWRALVFMFGPRG